MPFECDLQRYNAVRWHDERVARLRSAPDVAMATLWWPFTQHDAVSRANVAVIDSRCGEDFGVYAPDGDGRGLSRAHNRPRV